MFMIKKAYAINGKGGRGSQNRAGSGNNYKASTDAQRRGNESAGNYTKRTGYSFGRKIAEDSRGNYAGTGRLR